MVRRQSSVSPVPHESSESRRACAKSGDHYRELSRVTEISAQNPAGNFPRVLGIVEAAHHDVESGLLFDMRSLISAELLGDFLEQADARAPVLAPAKG